MITITENLLEAFKYYHSGNINQAIQVCEQVLNNDLFNTDIIHYLGVLYYETGQLQVAIDYFSREIELKEAEGKFQTIIGNAATANNAFKRAESARMNAQRIQREIEQPHPIANMNIRLEEIPCLADLYNRFGNQLQDNGQYVKAESYYRLALEIRPLFPEALNNLGNALQQQYLWNEAIDCFQQALALEPNSTSAHNNIALALTQVGRIPEAVKHCHAVVLAEPLNADAHDKYAFVLQDNGNLSAAEAACREAIRIKPRDSSLLNHLGAILQEQGNLTAAVECYQQAISYNPQDYEARMNLAYALLLAGDFQHGWHAYEWRLNMMEYQDRISQLNRFGWNGEPINGKTILIIREQGLGDSLQFIRYATLLKQLKAKVLFCCQTQLIPLLKSSPDIDLLIPDDLPVPEFDYCVSLLSLPHLFRTDLNSIPADVPYLYADNNLIKHWSERLSLYKGLRVGIHWRGRERSGPSKLRNLPLNEFSLISKIEGIRLICLQQNINDEEASLLKNLGIIEFSGDLDNTSGPFMDTAAIMKNLDLVITCDTSIAHLAGGMGVPVWVALPTTSDWRWLRDREDSLWYPRMRLFRQRKRHDYGNVMQKISAALQKLIGNR